MNRPASTSQPSTSLSSTSTSSTNGIPQVAAVCVGPGGIPKHPSEGVALSPAGLQGDGHRYHLHGGENRAVCLLSTEDYATMQRDGVETGEPGAFGENLLIDNLDFRALRPGMRLAVGTEVILQIHDIREPCKTIQTVDPRFPALMEGRSGFVCRVEKSGWLAPGLQVQILD